MLLLVCFILLLTASHGAIPVKRSVGKHFEGVFVWKNYPLVIGRCVPYRTKMSDGSIKSFSYLLHSCQGNVVYHTVFYNGDCLAQSASHDGDEHSVHSALKSVSKHVFCPSGGFTEDQYGMVDLHLIEKLTDTSSCDTLINPNSMVVPERTLKMITNMCFVNPEPGATDYKWIECDKSGTIFSHYANGACTNALQDYAAMTTDCSPILDSNEKSGLLIQGCTKPTGAHLQIAPTQASAATNHVPSLLAVVSLALFVL